MEVRDPSKAPHRCVALLAGWPGLGGEMNGLACSHVVSVQHTVEMNGLTGFHIPVALAPFRGPCLGSF